VAGTFCRLLTTGGLKAPNATHNTVQQEGEVYGMRPILVAFAAVLLMLTPLAAQTLTGSDLKAALSGKSGTWRTKDGKFSGTTTYNTDGTAQTTGNFGAFTEDTGVWSIRGDKLCATWKKVRGGKEACFAVKRLPDGRLDLGRNVLTMK
jgi:hypothetical protein